MWIIWWDKTLHLLFGGKNHLLVFIYPSGWTLESLLNFVQTPVGFDKFIKKNCETATFYGIDSSHSVLLNQGFKKHLSRFRIIFQYFSYIYLWKYFCYYLLLLLFCFCIYFWNIFLYNFLILFLNVKLCK